MKENYFCPSIIINYVKTYNNEYVFVLMFYFYFYFRFGSKIAEQSAANSLRTVLTRTGPARNKLKVHPHNPLPPRAAALPLHSHTPARLPGNRVQAPLPPSPRYHPGRVSTVHRQRIVSSCQARLAACRK